MAPTRRKAGAARCVVCGRAAEGVCPICQSATYCSRSCQKLDWLEDHATICTPASPEPPETTPEEVVHEGPKPLSDLVQLWRVSVEKLWIELQDEEDLEHLSELAPLLTEAEESRNGHWLVPRCELSLGQRPILVTAPHSMALLRDGQAPHLVEGNTAEIAGGIAEYLGGSCLTWSLSERRRTELLWRLSKRVNQQRGALDIRDGHLLDPRNRDPNFLATGELNQNLWFQQMSKALQRMQTPDGRYLETLHVDVHGCQDPPNTPSHLTIGLGAMCFHAIDLGDSELFEWALHFGDRLHDEFQQVLSKASTSGRLRPRALLVRVAAPPSAEAEDECPRFSGAWRGMDRHTQSQQAVGFVGFSHSLQLEFSKALRQLLVMDDALLARFADALRTAWAHAKQYQTKAERMDEGQKAVKEERMAAGG